MQPMKGFNFRFSEREIALLDQLVQHYAGREDFRYYMRSVTRTDVLKMLISKRIQEINDEAAAAVAAEAEKVKTRKRIFGKPILKARKR
jgi:hypothetical protein